MKLLKPLLVSAVAVCALSFVKPAQAGPVLDAGWSSDEITQAATDSLGSPYSFSLAGAADFSITDAYVVGDTFKVYDFGSLILTTVVGAGVAFAIPSDSYADSAWASGSYGIGTVTLGAGSHQITVQGDGAGGLPAGFFDRLDTSKSVPDSSATFGLISLGLVAIVAARKRLC